MLFKGKNILEEFKEFAIKGNMIDIAVGVIIGSAFNQVIDVLVKKVIMPPLSLITDGINFIDKKIILRHALKEGGKIIKEEVYIGYGELLTVLLNFLIISFTVFIVIRVFNQLRKNAEDTKNKQVSTPKNIELLSDLKLLMQEQNALLKEKNKANS